MQYQEFLGQVQNRARLAAFDDAAKATRATLETLAERLYGNEADHIASQLPEEIAIFLKGGNKKTKYTVNEFFQKVSEKEGVELPEAVFHTRVVIDVLKDAVSKGEFDHVRDQLPADYNRLFDSGSQGNMKGA